jgi:hypothetical protein
MTNAEHQKQKAVEWLEDKQREQLEDAQLDLIEQQSKFRRELAALEARELKIDSTEDEQDGGAE